MVASVNETVNWYKENLGFQLVMSVPEEGEMDWAMVQREDVAMMFQNRKSVAEEFNPLADVELGGSMSFFTKMFGIDELYEKIVDRASIVKEPYITFYGTKELMIKDCNGYYFTFAEDMEK